MAFKIYAWMPASLDSQCANVAVNGRAHEHEHTSFHLLVRHACSQGLAVQLCLTKCMQIQAVYMTVTNGSATHPGAIAFATAILFLALVCCSQVMPMT